MSAQAWLGFWLGFAFGGVTASVAYVAVELLVIKRRGKHG